MANNTGKKFGGREQGTPNKVTKELRTALKNMMANEIEAIPELLSKLEPKERLELTCKLLVFILPKMEPINTYDGEPFGSNWDE